MDRLYLRIQAPFAVFRGFEAGNYLSTAPTITYSAAWGLLLNLAGIEIRLPNEPTTLVRPDAPPLRIAIGPVKKATISSLYQQLHIYLVGSGDEKTKEARSATPLKTNIRTYRREVLVGFDVQLAVEGEADLLNRIVAGLSTGHEGLYGLPFLGDNNFLIESIEVMSEPIEVPWYRRVTSQCRDHSCRLTVAIDRMDSSRTSVALVAPDTPSGAPPEASWFWVPQNQAQC